jgi:cyclopropane fatty-acyl-phospholipid synthase-like methyltransferase
MAWINKRLTGEPGQENQPGELALFASHILRENSRYHGNIDILDLGCGNGQDAFYLARQLDCHILGIDNSEASIKAAKDSCPKDLVNRIEFLCYDFSAVIDKFDMIFVSNLYYLLTPDERIKLRETVRRCLKNVGWLFLNTLSASNTQQKDLNHFSTRGEIEKEFDFLNISALFEREAYEDHNVERARRRIFWLLMGNLK